MSIESSGGSGDAMVTIDIPADSVTAFSSYASLTPNDQTAYFYFAVYYGIEDYTDEEVLDILASQTDFITYEDKENYVDFSQETETLLGIFIIPFNANNEEGTRVAIRFTEDGLVGLQDVNIPTLNVYPNPANSNVTITSSTSIDRIEISNILGQKVYEDATVGANQTTINVSGLQNGAYFVRVYGENCTMTRKLIVK